MISYWLLAARPKTLTVSVCPVLLGLALSLKIGPINILVACITVLAALLIQLGTNFANDYYDAKKGADVNRIGPKRMTQSGAISAAAMKRATYITFGLALAIGLVLVGFGGWPILLIGLTGIACGYWYTAGPYALAYIGGAELVSFGFFGPVAVGATVYLQHHVWTSQALLLGCGVGCIASALLVVNNTRDIQADQLVNKRTLAVRFGRWFSYIEYVLLMFAPIILLDVAVNESPTQLIGIIGLVVIATWLTRTFSRSRDAAFNQLLFLTSIYLIAYTGYTIILL